MSFDVHDGEVFFIIGASGVGKSVLIKHLVGLLYPDAGEIWLDGEDVDAASTSERMYAVRKKCAMVFQHSTLFDSMTLRRERRAAAAQAQAASAQGARSPRPRRTLLEQVHMQDFARPLSRPSSATACASASPSRARSRSTRATCSSTSRPPSLDPVSARRVDKLIRELADTLGVTSIVVSHDLDSIFGIADRIAMLYRGEVRILGTPDDSRPLERRRRPAVHHRPRRRPDGVKVYATSRDPMSQRSMEVKVGVLILVALGLLVGFVVVMGGLSFQPTYTVYVDFDNPGGLKPGAPVQIAGVRIGRVAAVSFRGGKLDVKTGERLPLIRVVASLESQYKSSIYENSKWFVTTQGRARRGLSRRGSRHAAIITSSPTAPR